MNRDFLTVMATAPTAGRTDHTIGGLSFATAVSISVTIANEIADIIASALDDVTDDPEAREKIETMVVANLAAAHVIDAPDAAPALINTITAAAQ